VHTLIVWSVLLINLSTGEVKGAQPLTFESMEQCQQTVLEYIKLNPAPPGSVAKGYCIDPTGDKILVVEPGASRT
jgi:hypothetical protein